MEQGKRRSVLRTSTARSRRNAQEKELPVGRHPFQLYSLATPNGVKVTVMFEEFAR